MSECIGFRNLRKRLAVALLVSQALACSALAAIKPNGIFADHMILQRESTVPVWGTADAGEAVDVEFAGQKKSTTADATGRWRVDLDALSASAEPRDLKIGTVVVHDVLVGEVWLAGGQSNMRSPLFAAHNADEALASADDLSLRYFDATLRTSAEPQTSALGAWKVSTKSTARDFSAVGYFFAKELRQKLNCPVGIIGAAWGGTPIQTWISLDGLNRQPPLAKTLADWNKAVEQYKKILADPKLEADYESNLQRWRKDVEPAYNAAVKAYNEAKASGKEVGEKPKPSEPEPNNPNPMGKPSPSRRPQTPTVSFNGIIAPIAPFSIRGFLWYQGEANGSAGIEYRSLFPRLIEDWRAHWQRKSGSELPFLFVQLPANGPDKSPVAENGWPWVREAQWMALRSPRTAMAITIDIGDPNNVHPADKLHVGQRLALLARRDVYGEKIAASGPLFQGAEIKGDRIRVRFTETAAGLKIGQAPWRATGVEPLPMDRLVGFYIAGADRKWAPADAVIDGDSVIVSAASVTAPLAVRYGWANSPRCNLYNSEDLPASPFRTDDWENTK